MKSINYLTTIAFLTLALTACGQDNKSTPKPTTDASTKKTAKPQASTKKSGTKNAAAPKASDGDEADPAMDKEDIPVAADFEEKAEKEITEKNLDEEFSKLEKEVTGK